MWKNYLKAIIVWVIVLFLLRFPLVFLSGLFPHFFATTNSQLIGMFLLNFIFPLIATLVSLFVFSRSLKKIKARSFSVRRQDTERDLYPLVFIQLSLFYFKQSKKFVKGGR